MKNLFRNLMLGALATLTFTACEDVPEPYSMPVRPAPLEATGDGSLENPFNSVAATNECKKLENGGVTATAYYIKGKVVSIATSNGTELNFDQGTYGNATFYISDDGTSAGQFYCYRVLYLGNKKWTQGAGDPLKVGDDVIVCAKLTMYNTTPETQQNEGFLYSLNGKTEGGGVNPPTPSGENILTNGDFESWTDGLPDHWKTSSTAGNATLTQSTDAHGGQYAVSVGFTASANKRLGHEEITLKAGTYAFSFYAKSTTAEKSQSRAGYVAVTNGTADSQGYQYGSWATLSNTEWTLVTTTFTLAAQTTVALVMMNPKTSDYAVAQDILVDDATLQTSDGGIANGDDPTPPTPSGEVKKVTVAEFNAAAESTDVWYQITGTVKNLKDGDLYGNFDLEDETGSVYVYGLLSEKGGAKKQFQDLANAKGIKNGSKITIIGNRGSYQGKIEVMNAYFVSIGDDNNNDTPDNPTPSGEVKAVSVAAFNAAAESTDVWYQLTGTVSNLKDGDMYGNFDLTDDTGSVYVYGLLSEKGGAKKKFQDLANAKGIKNGSKITIVGNRGSYQGKIEVMNAYFVSVN